MAPAWTPSPAGAGGGGAAGAGARGAGAAGAGGAGTGAAGAGGTAAAAAEVLAAAVAAGAAEAARDGAGVGPGADDVGVPAVVVGSTELMREAPLQPVSDKAPSATVRANFLNKELLRGFEFAQSHKRVAPTRDLQLRSALSEGQGEQAPAGATAPGNRASGALEKTAGLLTAL